MRTRERLSFDRRHLWHPYASTTRPGPLLRVVSADGTRLVLDDGSGPVEVVDAMASWWCMIHGYRHPALDAAVAGQVGRFSHVMFGGLTHDPALGLVERLLRLVPPGLDRVFLADSGSVAMEVALKLARQVQAARAQAGARPRTRFAALRGAYHGDTWGVMALCDPDGGMHAMYSGAVQRHLFLPRPPAFDASPQDVATWADEARALVHGSRDELAGIVVEPILQGAGGMWPWAPGALRELRAIADEYQVLLIADEIATGLGRTGRLFACEWAEVVPDVLVLGKALTGGYLTQAAVITTDALAAEVSRGPGGALMHGPTFMANPLACAVSSASLDLIATGSWRDDVARIGQVLAEGLEPLAAHESVRDVRVLGGMAVVEAHAPVDLEAATRTAVAHGVWLRPFGRLVYAMPPYLSTSDDLRRIAAAMGAVVRREE